MSSLNKSYSTIKAGKEIYQKQSDLVLYVEPNEKNGDGTSDRPFGKIKEAYTAAVNAINEGTAKEVVIYLRRGTHILDKALLMDGKEITKKEYHITFTGSEDRDNGAIVTTNQTIPFDMFQPVDNEPYYLCKLPEDFKDKDGSFPAFRNLWIDNKWMSPAKSSRGIFTIDSARYAEKYAKTYADVDAKKQLLYIRPSTLCGVATDNEGYFIETLPDGKPCYDKQNQPIRKNLEMVVQVEWMIHYIRVDRVLPPTSYFVEDTNEYLVPVHVVDYDWDTFKTGYNIIDLGTEHIPYWFQNNRAFLSKPGDFYYDHTNGYIYVCPYPTETKNHTVSIPRDCRIFDMQDMGNISFTHLTIHGGTMNYITDCGLICGQGGQSKRIEADGSKLGFLPFGAIYGVNVHDITISNCNVSNCGTDGINLSGGVENISVCDNIFRDLGGSAVRCGQSYSTYNETIYNRNIQIKNNYIDNIAIELLSNTGIFISSARDLDISYNTLLNMPYSAISVGYSWGTHWNDSDYYDSDEFVNLKNVKITHNYIENYMYTMSDGGAIYTLGANATGRCQEHLNEISYNYIIVRPDISGVGRNGWHILYGDQGSSHWHYTDNMLVLGDNLSVPFFGGYMFFNMDGTTQPYHNLVERLFIVNYPIDHKDTDKYPENYNDPTHKKIVGWNVIFGPERNWKVDAMREFTEKTTYDEKTGAFMLYNSMSHVKVDGDSKLTEFYNPFRECYLYRDVNEAKDAAMMSMKEIYENSGCTFMKRPSDFAAIPVLENQ